MVKATVNWVEVEAVTTPNAPLLNATVLLAGVVVENPAPVIIKVVALVALLGGLTVFTVGAETTVATWTGVPLIANGTKVVLLPP